MKILHLDSEGGFGGSSRSLQFLTCELAKQEVEIEVWHAKKGPSNNKLIKLGVNSHINKNIVSIIPLPKNNIKNILLLLPRLLRLFKLRAQIIEASPDILHLNYNGLLPICFLLRRKGYKNKIIVHTRTIIPNNYFGKLFVKLYKYVDENICISEKENNQLKEVNKYIFSQITSLIIYNCASELLLRTKLKFPKKKYKVIFLGTIDYVRAPDRIIELALTTKKMNLPVIYYIYGNEGFKSWFSKKNLINHRYIKKQILDKNLGKVVFFRGFTDNPDKAITESDILIRPSRKGDCWGRDIIEAMSAGLFVISTGSEQIFIKDNFNGLLIGTWNTKKVALKIKKYIEDNVKYMDIKKQARMYAKKNFNSKIHALKFYNFATSILNNDYLR